MILDIYTDASYCDEFKIAACGYTPFVDRRSKGHVIFTVKDVRDSREAEMYAVKYALEDLKNNIHCYHHINVYTDLEDTVLCFYGKKLPEYMQPYKSILEPIVNEYKFLIDICGRSFSLQFHKVKGHAKKATASNHEIKNRRIDKILLRALRETRQKLSKLTANNNE